MFESCRGRQDSPGTYAATPIYRPVVTSHREYPDLGGKRVRIFAEVLA